MWMQRARGTSRNEERRGEHKASVRRGLLLFTPVAVLLMSSHEPLNKRQTRGDEDEATEIIAFGGPMYDEATARKMLKEVVLISADDSEDGEAVIGFDLDYALVDHVSWLENLYYAVEGNLAGWVTPMAWFAEKGDAKMCRYLISRGVSTTKSGAEKDDYYSPLFAAADEGHLDVCKILYANGAQNDIRRCGGRGRTPFHAAANKDHDEVLRWLTLHGALCADASSEEIDEDCIYPKKHVFVFRERMASSYKRLVEWAKMVVQTHSAVVMFLGGTLSPAPNAVQSRTLQCLSGHPGVRKHIGDFVGMEVTKGKHLRILRNVVGGCAAFL